VTLASEAEWKIRREQRALYGRQLPHLRERAIQELTPVCLIETTCLQIDPHHGLVRDIEARIVRHHFERTPHVQSRHNQEQRTRCDLCQYEPRASPPAVRRAGGASVQQSSGSTARGTPRRARADA